MCMKQKSNVMATYPVFLEIARRRQSIRRVLQSIAAPQVFNRQEGGAL